MTSTNKQLRNTGNLGDILKHGALVRLALLMASKPSSERPVYVDTHAFLLSAPCSAPERWLLMAGRELAAHRDYYDYFSTEYGLALDQGSYRCSAGLVLDILRSRDPRMILGESDVPTRRLLQAQLADEAVVPYALVEDARHIMDVDRPSPAGPLLALVDPFELDAELWTAISTGLESLVTPGMPAIVEVFTYDRGRSRLDWPEPPRGLSGPVAVVQRPPYHLAVYTSRDMESEVAGTCSDLGWEGRYGK